MLQYVTQVPRIAELRETVIGIKNELVEQTSQAFNQVGQLASLTADPEGFQRDDKPGQFRSLHEACLVVDALGGQAREQQVGSAIVWELDSHLLTTKAMPCLFFRILDDHGHALFGAASKACLRFLIVFSGGGLSSFFLFSE